VVLKQLQLSLILQPTDALTHSALGKIELIGRIRKTSMANYGIESHKKGNRRKAKHQ
jgi:hypothetical protein